MKEKLQFCLDKISLIRSKLPKKKPHSEKYYKMIAFLNKYSLVFHFILACVLTFAIEVISRRDFLSTISFLHNHTLAYLYNAFIVFASLSIVYLFRCRAQLRVLISGLWLFLGTINGLILSNRVTPFSYTDLKCISDLFAMQNTNYFTAEEATLVVGVVVVIFVFLGFFLQKGQNIRENVILYQVRFRLLLYFQSDFRLLHRLHRVLTSLLPIFPISLRVMPIMVLYTVFPPVWLAVV